MRHSSRTSPSSGVVEIQRRIAAPRETVFSFFTDAERYRRWQGIAVELDPRPGGLMRIVHNNEGFVSPAEMHDLLRRIGPVQVCQTRYNTFRGSRKLRNRDMHVTEQLFLVERR